MLFAEKWAGIHEGEPWTIEVGYDRYTESEPWVVDVWIDFLKDDDITGGAFMSPEQAREMAAALLRNADACEKANEQG